MFISSQITSNAGYCKTNAACCQETSIAINSPSMATTKRRALSPDEMEDASRLRALLEEKKRTEGMTQETIGHLCGWAGQQAVQAYSSGNTPINLDAAFRFAKALNVPLDSISPRLAARAVELFGSTQAALEPPQTIEALIATLQDDIAKEDNDVRMAIADLVHAYKNDPDRGKEIARSIRVLLGKL